MKLLLLFVIVGCFMGCGPSETATRPTNYQPAPRGDAETGSGPGTTINSPPEPK